MLLKDYSISEVDEVEGNFKRQFHGYRRDEVDGKITEMNKIIEEQKATIETLQSDLQKMKVENALMIHRSAINEKTNEEIARLALKEASELIDKAKRNANMILKESMEYVKGLNGEVDGLKDEAKTFRAEVVKISQEMLETIDNSEIFGLIKEEPNTKKETVSGKRF